MTIFDRPAMMLTLVLALSLVPGADLPADDLLASLRALAKPLQHPDDLVPLVDAAGDTRLVLLGEASHGTREFYAWRQRLSRRLIEGQGFSFIVVEGDWASLLPLDRYVRHHPDAPGSAREALLQIERWPSWIWANHSMVALGEWLRAFNRGRAPDHRVGIHGMDLYAVWESLDAVEAFYRSRLPESAPRVRALYRFLRGFRGDSPGYADYVRRTRLSARLEVAQVVRELAVRYRRAGAAERDGLFEALQHARVVEAGERYLRLMAAPGHGSWNTRAEHFARTVARLLNHYGPGSRAIVWAHNTHIGDARATDMVQTGEVNIGQLLRERYGGGAVFALGFGTAAGSVRAAPRWEGPGEVMQIPAPRPDSLEAALLTAGNDERLLILDRALPATRRLHRALPHRAIGVVFDPASERWRNYIPTRLADRYDAFIFLPFTHALEPLHAP